MEKTFRIRVFRRKKMSEAGFGRLDRIKRLNYKKEVYPIAFDGSVKTYLIESERELARWLFTRFGEGYYVILGYRLNTKSKRKGHKCLTKALAKVEITSVEENKTFDYHYYEKRGISRYTSFWMGE